VRLATSKQTEYILSLCFLSPEYAEEDEDNIPKLEKKYDIQFKKFEMKTASKIINDLMDTIPASNKQKELVLLLARKTNLYLQTLSDDAELKAAIKERIGYDLDGDFTRLDAKEAIEGLKGRRDWVARKMGVNPRAFFD